MPEYFGEFGGEVLRAFKATVDGKDKEYGRGDTIPSADTKGWSFVVRKTLASSGKVRWFVSKYEEMKDSVDVEELKKSISEKDKQIRELQDKIVSLNEKQTTKTVKKV